ncbi:beta-xylosidase [Verticillium dahliae VdLs.17]|uniref:Beta-xylosidase n=1 Tax=Verticillium dahliae (strain VdLs.17 / ATCC MYA-4575 / FGSC 10137) TaxID=498257 RepID=G2X8N2_VERDV|nr:beta-xylosidase [Verticillium dahliae VdLs.17]EGY15319.1 beta-xylosidase [Verticillium dahliae VdLs.17]
MKLISTLGACLTALFADSVTAIWNPIIPGWNPDASILRVKDDYYIATSSIEYYPGIPIYHSKDLANWTLKSHAFTRPEQLPLYGTPTSAGAWAPSLSYFKGKFWIASMTRWTYDPVARVWPRVFFASSADLVTWSDPVWADPWGIDPELFHDPVSGKTYLNLMAPNNNADRLWGLAGCEVSVSSGRCVGPYVSLWNGTLPHVASARPEGPKTVFRDGYYYLIAAEGREGFLVEAEWVDGWPVLNGGRSVLLSEQVGAKAAGARPVPEPWVDDFSGPELDKSWYQLRTPYTQNYKVFNGRLVLRPNVFGLSDRDTPAALLRKQTSLNMTFSAELLGFKGSLGPRNRIGISSYLSEFQHQDIGLRGCVNATGMCLYAELRRNLTTEYWQTPLNESGAGLSSGLTLHIRATPLKYELGYSLKGQKSPTYVKEIESRWQAFAPAGWFVFSGNSFGLFATGEGEPWPYNAPDVGFTKVTETYFKEDIPDYDRW